MTRFSLATLALVALVAAAHATLVAATPRPIPVGAPSSTASPSTASTTSTVSTSNSASNPDFLTIVPVTPDPKRGTPMFLVTDDGPATLNIQMKATPGTSTPRFFFQGDVYFDKCSLDFTADSYNKDQQLKLYPKPVFTRTAASTETPSIFAVRAAWQANTAVHGKTQSMSFNRVGPVGVLCQSMGDPHFTTFDGRKFDYMGNGCYHVVKSDTLSVQSRQFKPDKVTYALNIGVAVAYGKTVYIVDAINPDATKRLVLLSADSTGVTKIENAGGSDYQFHMSDGSQVKVTVYNGGKPNANIDLQVTLPSCYQSRTEGLCGVYDNNANNDLSMPRVGNAPAVQTTNVNQFGDSWAIQKADDLFATGLAALASLNLHQPPSTLDCAFPADLSGFGVAPPPAGYDDTPPAQTVSYDATPMPTTVGAVGRTDAAFNTTVTKLCKRVVKIPGLVIPAGLSAAPTLKSYIDDCVKDAMLTASTDTMDGFRIQYQRYFYTIADTSMTQFQICPKTHGPRHRTDAELAAQRQTLGMDAYSCTSDDGTVCGGHGACNTYGCMCNTGWGGAKCDINLATELAAGLAKATAQPATK